MDNSNKYQKIKDTDCSESDIELFASPIRKYTTANFNSRKYNFDNEKISKDVLINFQDKILNQNDSDLDVTRLTTISNNSYATSINDSGFKTVSEDESFNNAYTEFDEPRTESEIFNNYEDYRVYQEDNSFNNHHYIEHSQAKNVDCKVEKSPSYNRIKNSISNDLNTNLLSSKAFNARKRTIHKSFGTPKAPNSDIKRNFFGLPLAVKEVYTRIKRITTLYDWQTECLSLKCLNQRKNLIVTTPTSGGKTLISEVLVLKELIVRRKQALFVLPYISLAQEKVRSFSKLALEFNFAIEEYAGNKGQIPPKKRQSRPTLFVGTIEKITMLVNSLIEFGRERELGLIVIDELHMIGDSSRGHILEGLLTKLIHSAQKAQIIGMSATLSNINEMASFLKAEIFNSSFRPVKLTEKIACDNELRKIRSSDELGEPEFSIIRKLYPNKDDPGNLCEFVREVIPEKSCLIFCPTKRKCESLALSLVKKLPQSLKTYKLHEKVTLLKELTDDNQEICDVLREIIPYGFAYHHSGLTNDERVAIEEAFLSGVLCLIFCTSTLAAGINLPAARVIIYSSMVGNSSLSNSQYKQMIGRAGRAGLDLSGDSILINRPAYNISHLLHSTVEDCTSSLFEKDKFSEFILSALALKLATNTESLFSFVSKTLAFEQSKNKSTIPALINETLDFLLQTELLRLNSTKENYILTNIGKGCYKACIKPDNAKCLYDELSRNLDFLTLKNTSLHLFYLITPDDNRDNIPINWQIYLNEIFSLEERELKLLKDIGISEAFISKKCHNLSITTKPGTNVDIAIIEKFYLALILRKLWKNNCQIRATSNCFQIRRGSLQSFFSNVIGYAYRLIMYCQEFSEFWPYVSLLEPFLTKLHTQCIPDELLKLMQIPGIKLARVKQLYSAGYTNFERISVAKIDDLVKKLEFPKNVAEILITSTKMILDDQMKLETELYDEKVKIFTQLESLSNENSNF